MSDAELLTEFHRVVSDLGRVPTWKLFQQKSSISADVIRRRFGGLQHTLSRYRDWLEANEPNSPTLDLLAIRSAHEVVVPTSLASQPAQPGTQWTKGSGTEYGAPINFRGLRHAPINEQGVVYLFGMISYELGFLVEAVHTAFPDCEAKRRVDSKRDRWQKVRIEFEYLSRTFVDHGHNPDGCDLIVCWEDNWPGCSVEVLELRTAIGTLDP